MEDESGVTRSIIDALHSLDLVKWKMKAVLLKVQLMNFLLEIANEMKRSKSCYSRYY